MVLLINYFTVLDSTKWHNWTKLYNFYLSLYTSHTNTMNGKEKLLITSISTKRKNVYHIKSQSNWVFVASNYLLHFIFYFFIKNGCMIFVKGQRTYTEENPINTNLLHTCCTKACTLARMKKQNCTCKVNLHYIDWVLKKVTVMPCIKLLNDINQTLLF